MGSFVREKKMKVKKKEIRIWKDIIKSILVEETFYILLLVFVHNFINTILFLFVPH
jgi:hypothetical protein